MNKGTGLLKGKAAIVTGASRGIGRAIARALGGEGATLVLAGRDEQKLDEVRKEIGGDHIIAAFDMADDKAIAAMVKQVKERLGRVDVLVNNAGVTYSGKLEETPTADWDRVMAVNARGPYVLCREVIPLMRETGGGRIINISSVVGAKGYAQQTLYGASKHALRGMSIALAEELRDDNIRVHVVCPGGVATDMVKRVRPDINDDELMQAEEIAEMVHYLATHEGNAVMDEVRLRRATSAPWFAG